MIRFCGSDPTGRFTGLADLYARYRPDYSPRRFLLLSGLAGDTLKAQLNFRMASRVHHPLRRHLSAG
jgi:hypothetical protein